MHNSVEKLRKQCGELGLTLTPQRLCVYETLMEMTGHPGVDEVYKRTSKKMPTISLNTIYSVLSWLEENGFILSVPLRDSPKKFDTVASPHHHLVCIKCGKIIDVHENMDVKALLPGFIEKKYFILSVGVTVNILCEGCRGKKINKTKEDS